MSDLDLAVTELIDQLRHDGKLMVRPAKRCRICRDDALRPLINKLLSLQLSYPTILDMLSSINNNRPEDEKITRYSLRSHAQNHFDSQQPAVSMYSQIARRRAEQEGLDYETAVGSMLTPLAYYDTVMHKSYEDLLKDQTKPTTSEGMSAAKFIYEVTRKDAGMQEQAEMLAKINRLISVVRAIVPERYHGPIIAALEGREVEMPLDVETVQEIAPAELPDDDDDDED